MTDRNGGVPGVPALERPRSAAWVARAWERWSDPLIWAAVGYSVIAAVGHLRAALPHLLRDVEEWSAVDFKYRFEEVSRWFDGVSVYGALDRLTYPPASYALLWPFIGWLPLDAARVMWAVTTLAAAAVVAFVAYRATEGRALSLRVLAALLPFAAYPTQVTVYVGQLPVHVVALVALGAFVLWRVPIGWAGDVAGGVLLAASLVKPTLAPPVVAAVLISTGRWRPALLTAACYLAFSFAGAAAQSPDIITLHRAWLESSANPSLVGGIAEGVPSLHMLLTRAGLGGWAPVASLAALVAFAAWAWRHRRADLWLLAGAGAVVARLWSYHREYDDAILLLAAVALLRVHRGPETSVGWMDGLLFAAVWAALLTPTWVLFSPNVPIVRVLQGVHTAVWVAVLVVVARRAARDAGVRMRAV
jgi:hypothetical protein